MKLPPSLVLFGMSAEAFERHMNAAIPEANRLLAEAEKGKIKPYENCIAYALAMMKICKQFAENGRPWDPQQFLAFAKLAMDADEAAKAEKPEAKA